MNRRFKWLFIIGGGLIVFFFATILIAALFIDVQKYKPELENRVSEATGLPFVMGGDLRLSLFPWVSIAADDIHLGNPPGFEGKDLVSVASFEVRVKVVPLVLSLFKDIQVKPFLLKGVRIVLETREDGTTNLEGIGKTSAENIHKPQPGKEKPSEGKPGRLPVDAITIDEFAVTDGSLLWIDHAKGKRFEVSDLSLKLREFSLDRPIHIIFSAQVDGHPLSIEGHVGPLGKDLGKGVVPLDLTLGALKLLDVKLKGNVTDAASDPSFAMSIEASPFSLRKLVAEMGQNFPLATADPQVLRRLAFNVDLKGDTNRVSVSDGVVEIDESTINLSGKAENFSRPDVSFHLKLDEIDLDRYLAAETEKEPAGDDAKTAPPGPGDEKSVAPGSGKQKTDYGPLRNLVLNGTIQIGKLKAANAGIQDLNLKVVGKNGVFHLDPLNLNLYQGNVSAKGSLNVKKDTPESGLTLRARDIHVGPLLNDIADKDILEGKLNADTALKIKGDDAEIIKRSLNGEGSFFVVNGAIKGIDLVSMVRNTDGAYGFAHKADERPRTEFNELQASFSIKNGVFYTDDTRMVSTLIRVQSTGKADLVGGTLDFRIEPAFVTTRKDDVEEMKRSEVMIPVLVTGNLSDPKFRPDLRGIAKKKLEEEVFESSKFKEIFEKEELKPLEEGVKGLLKGILD